MMASASGTTKYHSIWLLGCCSIFFITFTPNSIALVEAQELLPDNGYGVGMPTTFFCPTEGLFADDYDCQTYYRCEQKTEHYIKPYMFSCKESTVFSRTLKLCMPPILAGREECMQYMNEITNTDIDSINNENYNEIPINVGLNINNNEHLMDENNVLPIDNTKYLQQLPIATTANTHYNQLQKYGLLTGLSGVSVISFSTTSTRSTNGVDDALEPPCETDGFMSDPDDCTIFYRCISNGQNFNKIGFRCSKGTAWDEVMQSCNHISNVRANGGCQGRATQIVAQTSTQSAQTNQQNTTSSSSSTSSQQQTSTSSSSSSSSSSTTSSSSSSSSNNASTSSTTQSNASNSSQSSSMESSTSSESSSTQSSSTANNQQSSSNSSTNNQSSTESNSNQSSSNTQENSQEQSSVSQNGSNNQSSNQSNSSTNSNNQTSANNSNSHPTDCQNDETYIPDQYDCSKFYRCRKDDNGHLIKVPFTCGPGTIWNHNDRACDVPSNAQKEKCKLSNSSSQNGQQIVVSESNQNSSNSNQQSNQESHHQQSSNTNNNQSNNENNQNSNSSSQQSNQVSNNQQSSSNNNNQSNNQGSISSNQQSSSNNNNQSNSQNSSNDNTDNQTTIQKPLHPNGECTSEDQYLSDKKNCQRFYRCVGNGSSGFTKVPFDCAPGTVWDADSNNCNFPTDVQNEICKFMANEGQSQTNNQSSSTVTNSNQDSNAVNQSSTSNNAQSTSSSSQNNESNSQENSTNQTSQSSSSQHSSSNNQSSSAGSSSTQSTISNSDVTSSNSQGTTNQGTGSSASSSTTSSQENNSSTSQEGSSSIQNESSNQTNHSSSNNNSSSTANSSNSNQSSSTSSSTNHSSNQSSTTQTSSSSNSNNSNSSSQQSTNTENSNQITSNSTTSGGSNFAPSTLGKPIGRCDKQTQFLADKNNCARFYRCIENGKGGYDTVSFTCAPATVWDTEINACNHAWAVKNRECGPSNPTQKPPIYKPTETPTHTESSTISEPTDTQKPVNPLTTTVNPGTSKPTQMPTASPKPTDQPDGICRYDGFIGDPNDCSKFYRCVSNGKDGFIQYPFKCGNGTVWDNALQTCNHDLNICNVHSGATSSPLPGPPTQKPESSDKPCHSVGTTSENPITASNMTSNIPTSTFPTTSTTIQPNNPIHPNGSCEKEGFFGDLMDCKKFYRCVSNNKGGFDKHSFMCGNGTIWDTAIEACNHAQKVKNPMCHIDSTTTENYSTTAEISTTKPPEYKPSTALPITTTNFPETSNVQTSPTTPTGTNSPDPTTTLKYPDTTTVPTTSTTIQPNEPISPGMKCEKEGFFGDSKDCQKFYRCVDNGKGGYDKHTFTCGKGTVWDADIEACNHPTEVKDPRCRIDSTTNGYPSTTDIPNTTKKPEYTTISSTTTDEPSSTSTGVQTTTTKYPETTMNIPTSTFIPTSTDKSDSTTTPNYPETTTVPTASTTIQPNEPILPGMKCKKEGFFGDSKDCQKFYRCVDNGKGGYDKHTFSCGKGTVWDADIEACNHPTEVKDPRCRINSTTNGYSSTTDIPNTTKNPEYTTISSTTTDEPSSASTGVQTTTTKYPETTMNIPTSTFIPTSTDKPDSTTTPKYPDTTTVPTASTTIQPNEPILPGMKCKKEGFFGDSKDCQKFYRCVDNGKGGYDKHTFSCGKGTVWDADIEACNHPTEVKDRRCRIDSTTNGYPSTTDIPNTTKKPEYTTISSTTTDEPSSILTGVQTTTTKYPETTMNIPTSTFIPTSTDKPDSTTTPKYPDTTTVPTTSTTIQPNEPILPGMKCKKEGFFGDSKDCQQFYRCVDNGKGGYDKHTFTCGKGTVWDADIEGCNHPTEIKDPRCRIDSTTNGYPSTTDIPNTTKKPEYTTISSTTTDEPSSTSTGVQTTTTKYPETTMSIPTSTFISTSTDKSDSTTTKIPDTTTMSPISTTNQPNEPLLPGMKCEKEGFFGDSKDCQKFYRCVDNGKGGYDKHTFSCGKGTVWDADIEACNHPTEVQDPHCQIESTANGSPSTTEKPGYTPTTLAPTEINEPSSTTTDLVPSTTNLPDSTTSVTTTNMPGYTTTTTLTTTAKYPETTEVIITTSSGKPDTTTNAISTTESIETTTMKYPDTTTDQPTTSQPPITPIPNLPPGTKCTGEGFMADPDDCTKFYRCVRNDDKLIKHEFTCPKNTAWSEDKQTCDHRGNVERCDGQTEKPYPTTTTITYPSDTTESTLSPTIPTQPSTEPTDTTTDGMTKPTELPTTSEEPTKPTEQNTEPTKPTEQPTESPTKPTEPTDPPTNPTEPPTEAPTKPTFLPTTTEQLPTSTTSISETTMSNPTTSNEPGYTTTTTLSTGATDTPTTTEDITENTTTEPINHICTNEGFFPDPENCERYYRCVESGTKGQYIIYSFRCPNNTVWDTSVQTCNYADKVSSNCSSGATPTPENIPSTTMSTTWETESSIDTTTMSSTEMTTTTVSLPTTTTDVTTSPTSTIMTTMTTSTEEDTTTMDTQTTTIITTSTNAPPINNGTQPCPPTGEGQHVYVCPTGFRRHPKHCNMFYQCTEEPESNDLNVVVFECPNGTVYHEQRNLCDIPSQDSDRQCMQDSQTRLHFYDYQKRRRNLVKIRTTQQLCPDEGHFALNNDECGTLFIKCEFSQNTLRLEGQIQRCPLGHAYWSVSRRCERTTKLQHCTPTNYSISSAIQTELTNIGYRRRSLAWINV